MMKADNPGSISDPALIKTSYDEQKKSSLINYYALSTELELDACTAVHCTYIRRG